MTRRILKILIWLIAGAILAVGLFLVVSASRLWLEYADPDPGLSETFGREIAAAAQRDPPLADFSRLEPANWSALSILGSRMTPQEIETCLGIAWDKKNAGADILSGDNALAIILSDGQAVTRASWGTELGRRLTIAGNVCAVPRAQARFRVETRKVEPGPGESFQPFTAYHLTQERAQ